MPAFWPLVSSSFHSCTSSTRHTILKVLPESASLTVARYYHSKLLLSGALINIPLIVHCCLIGRSCCIIRRWFILEAWREAYRRRSILGLGQQVARHRKQYVNKIILPCTSMIIMVYRRCWCHYIRHCLFVFDWARVLVLLYRTYKELNL